jgi:hypothetical protein
MTANVLDDCYVLDGHCTIVISSYPDCSYLKTNLITVGQFASSHICIKYTIPVFYASLNWDLFNMRGEVCYK